jgi:hypothetical protein
LKIFSADFVLQDIAMRFKCHYLNIENFENISLNIENPSVGASNDFKLNIENFE